MFSSWFDIYFFDELALATLQTVVISDSVSATPGELTLSAVSRPALAPGVAVGALTASASISIAIATVVTPAAGAITLGATLRPQLDLAATVGQIDLTASVRPTLAIVAGDAAMTCSGLVGNIFHGPIVTVTPGVITPAATASLSVAIPAVGTLTPSATVNTQVNLTVAPGALTLATATASLVTFARAAAVVRYYFTLTGAADGYDDVQIPARTIVGRVRQGTPSYLQVTLPGLDYITHIANRPNGEMVVNMVYVDAAGAEFGRREIARANLEDIRYDQGGQSQTITLVGHKTVTYGSPRTMTIPRPTYKSYSNGALRFRAPLDLAIYPGDTAVVGADSIVIDNLTYTIGVGQAHMEISEEAA